MSPRRSGYRVYLCGGDDAPLVSRPCSAGGRDHEPAPTGYVEWHEWAERMSRTHVSERCKACGLYGLWVAKATVTNRS